MSVLTLNNLIIIEKSLFLYKKSVN